MFKPVWKKVFLYFFVEHFKRFIERFFTDKSSALLIWLSVFIGILAGAVSALFDHGIFWVSEWRMQFIASYSDSPIPLWLVAIPVSSVMAGLAFYLTHKFAPEAGGSGIPEIEGAMEGMRPVRWRRVLPVKFFWWFAGFGQRYGTWT